MGKSAISVLIPTRRPGATIVPVLDRVFAQETDVPFEVLVVDSGSSPSELELIRRYPVKLSEIDPSDFGHGRTRNLLAEMASGDVLMYLSQDAEPVGSGWMAGLVAPLADEQVAGAYARQIPRPQDGAGVRFFLNELYGPAPKRRSSTMSPLTLDDMFFSNASSAIRRSVWEQVPFREDVPMSEDQYWARDALRLGFELCYEPTAQVYHTHDYSLSGLFRRNWLSGASLAGLIADEPRAIARRGASYVVRECAYVARHGAPHTIPYVLVYEATRAAAFWLGLRAGRRQARTQVPR